LQFALLALFKIMTAVAVLLGLIRLFSFLHIPADLSSKFLALAMLLIPSFLLYSIYQKCPQVRR